MLDSLTTPSNEADVTTQENETQSDQVEDQTQVEDQSNTEETTTASDDYDKAWDSIDTSEPPADLFGETTETIEEEKPSEESQPQAQPPIGSQVDQDQGGLVIQNPVLKHRGKPIPIDNEEELLRLAQQGLDYNIKNSKLKKLKPFQSIVDEGLTIEAAKAALDFVKGNHQALDYLKQLAGYKEEETSDFFDYGAEEQKKDTDYKPAVKQEDPVLEYFSTVSERDPELGGKVSAIYDQIDDSFRLEIYSPDKFPLFVKSIESGEFDKVYPHAVKMKAVNPTYSWLQAYIEAGKRLEVGKTTVADKAVQPPKGVEIPSNTEPSKRNVKKLDYDSAFNMDLKELEDRLFAN